MWASLRSRELLEEDLEVHRALGLGESDLDMGRNQGAMEGWAFGTLTVTKEDREESTPPAVHISQTSLLSLCHWLNSPSPFRKSV